MFKDRKKHFLQGMRDGIPIMLGYFAVSFSLGIEAQNAGLSFFESFFMYEQIVSVRL